MNVISASAGGQRGSVNAGSPASATTRWSHTTDERRVRRRLDWIATVLLALATVATAWAAYQARTWTGEQSQGYSHATAKRIGRQPQRRSREQASPDRCRTFIQWIDAHEHRDRGLADFYRARFRAEFKPAFRRLACDEALQQQGRAADAVRAAAVPAESGG
jgi:hypothetical protein